MSTFVCVPKIHTVGSSLMGCAGYCTWTVIHAGDFLHSRELIRLISLTFKSFYIFICVHVYVQHLFTKMTTVGSNFAAASQYLCNI